MGWHEIKVRHAELAAARDEGAPFAEPWRRFADAVVATRDDPPYHLRALLAALEEARGDRPAADVAILDHGCGAGLTLLHLLALGYRNIRGVDIHDACEGWNRLLAEEFGIHEQRFFFYEGHRLPLADDSIDYIFSQQVVEHVKPDAIEDYYAEEARVLRPGGRVFHQVPHRLVPYDSHARTWFIHYLPRPLNLGLHWALRVARPDLRQANLHRLFLRWPGHHRRALRRHFGPYSDRTADRLINVTGAEYYDGPAGLRRITTRAAGAPVAGPLVRAVLRNFVMLDTVAQKRSAEHG